MPHDVFVCHATEDKRIADAACAVLEQRGISCWIAPRDITPGRDYVEAITNAITNSRAVVLVFSAFANVSPHVKRELERAVSRGLPIVPIRVDQSEPGASLEYYISSVHWLDALTPPLAPHLERLAGAIEVLLSITERKAIEAFEPPLTESTSDDSLEPSEIRPSGLNINFEPPLTEPTTGDSSTSRWRVLLASTAGTLALVAVCVLAFIFFFVDPSEGDGPLPEPTAAPAPTSTSTTPTPIGPQAYTIVVDCAGAACPLNIHGETKIGSPSIGKLVNGQVITIACSVRGETVTDDDDGRSSDVWLQIAGLRQFIPSLYATGLPVPTC